MRILITGAGGFIGGHVARYLTANLADADIITPKRNDRIRRPFDVVVHCAAAAGPWNSQEAILRDNIEYTYKIVKLAAAYRAKFIYMSSISIYGKITASIVTEQTPTRDPDLYGKSKLLGEALLELYEDIFPSVSLRLPGVVGLGANEHNWLSRVIAAIKDHKPVEVYNTTSWFNNAVHVADICEFVFQLIINNTFVGHNPLVLGAKGDLTIQSVIDQLAEDLGCSSTLQERIGPSRLSFRLCSDLAQKWGYRPMDIRIMLHRFAEESR